MRFWIKRSDVLNALVAAAILGIVSAAAWLVIGVAAVLVAIALATLILLLTAFEIFRRDYYYSQTKADNDYNQIEALLSVFATIKPELPFPAMRHWAASPDLLKALVEIMIEERPQLVVEASSGVSTLVTAYMLKRNGGGKVISLEHDSRYAEITRRNIRFHKLEEYVTVIDAPLAPAGIPGGDWQWYDLEHFHPDRPIDLLVVDGPPNFDQPMSRYPALPKLRQYLNERFTILADDAIRDDQKKMVERWAQEYPGLKVEHLDLEKGAFVIHHEPATQTAEKKEATQ